MRPTTTDILMAISAAKDTIDSVSNKAHEHIQQGGESYQSELLIKIRGSWELFCIVEIDGRIHINSPQTREDDESSEVIITSISIDALQISDCEGADYEPEYEVETALINALT